MAETITASAIAGYLSKKELCAELHISKRTLNRWALLRTGPPRTRCGRRILYRTRNVLAWLESRTEEMLPGDAA